MSGSLYLLGRRSGALIIPWFTTYRGFARGEEELRYRPLALILHRLFGPKATILCQEGSPIDPAAFADQEALSRHIQELYARRKMSLESIS